MMNAFVKIAASSMYFSLTTDEGLRGAFGSMIGSQALDKKQSGVSTINVGTKQVFCRTAL